jgi:hypothetical protein
MKLRLQREQMPHTRNHQHTKTPTTHAHHHRKMENPLQHNPATFENERAPIRGTRSEEKRSLAFARDEKYLTPFHGVALFRFSSSLPRVLSGRPTDRRIQTEDNRRKRGVPILPTTLLRNCENQEMCEGTDRLRGLSPTALAMTPTTLKTRESKMENRIVHRAHRRVRHSPEKGKRETLERNNINHKS